MRAFQPLDRSAGDIVVEALFAQNRRLGGVYFAVLDCVTCVSHTGGVRTGWLGLGFGLAFAQNALLRDAGDQLAVSRVDRPAIETAGAARIRAIHGVKVPIAEIDRCVEPHGMIETG